MWKVYSNIQICPAAAMRKWYIHLYRVVRLPPFERDIFYILSSPAATMWKVYILYQTGPTGAFWKIYILNPDLSGRRYVKMIIFISKLVLPPLCERYVFQIRTSLATTMWKVYILNPDLSSCHYVKVIIFISRLVQPPLCERYIFQIQTGPAATMWKVYILYPD